MIRIPGCDLPHPGWPDPPRRRSAGAAQLRRPHPRPAGQCRDDDGDRRRRDQGSDDAPRSGQPLGADAGACGAVTGVGILHSQEMRGRQAHGTERSAVAALAARSCWAGRFARGGQTRDQGNHHHRLPAGRPEWRRRAQSRRIHRQRVVRAAPRPKASPAAPFPASPPRSSTRSTATATAASRSGEFVAEKVIELMTPTQQP